MNQKKFPVNKPLIGQILPRPFSRGLKISNVTKNSFIKKSVARDSISELQMTVHEYNISKFSNSFLHKILFFMFLYTYAPSFRMDEQITPREFLIVEFPLSIKGYFKIKNKEFFSIRESNKRIKYKHIERPIKNKLEF